MIPFEPRIIRNIKITWKLRLTALGFLLPVAILLYLLISEKNIPIDFTGKELNGMAYLQPLGELYRYMWELDRETVYLNSSGKKTELLSKKVDGAFRRLSGYENEFPSYGGISNELKEILALRREKNITSADFSAAEKGDLSLEMLDKIRFLMIDVGGVSNLLLEPKLEGYYLMNSVLARIPEVTFQLYQLIHYSDMIHNGFNMTPDEMARVQELNGILKSNMAKTRRVLQRAFQHNKDGKLKSVLSPKLEAVINRANVFTQMVDSALKTKTMPDKAYFESSALQAVDANYNLWKSSFQELDGLIKGRIDDLNDKKYAALYVVGSIIFLTALLFIFISGNITRSVEQLNEAANRVSTGDLNASVYINAKDELGNLGRNFNKMVARLRSLIKEKTDRFEEAEKELTNRIFMHKQQQEATSEQLRNLTTRLQSIREEERTMIAREIHDELGQVLTVLKIQISLLANKLRDDQSYLKEKIEKATRVIDDTVESVQRISAKLRPGILDDLGLISAIEWQAQDFQKGTGIMCKLSLPKEEIEMDEEKSTAIFRIFQEALTNVARYAGASLINVSLRTDDENLVLEVTDNGKGITEEQISDPGSLGLLGMKERAFMLGGSVVISGKPSRGTSVKVIMPCIRTKGCSETAEKNKADI